MSLPAFFFGRVSDDIRQQMDGVLALTEQLSRQRLTPDAEACVSGIAEAASAAARLMQAATDLRGVTTDGGQILGPLDEPLPQKLARQIPVLHDNPKATMVACGARIVDQAGETAVEWATPPPGLGKGDVWRGLLA